MVSRVNFRILLIAFLLLNCGSHKLTVIQEPVLNQISVLSPEICLNSFLWVPRNPCIQLRGSREEANGKQEYQLIYRLSSYDVEFPLGVSLEIEREFYNLTKVQTEYGATLELVSYLPESVLSEIEKFSITTISYTNRRETRNYPLTERQKARISEYARLIHKSLPREPKLKIRN